MGRGVSAGGGQSSLGYLFGSGEPPKNKAQASQSPGPVAVEAATPNSAPPPPSQKTGAASTPKNDKEIPAGIHGNQTNNYFRADGQNCGNFITVKFSLTFFCLYICLSLLQCYYFSGLLLAVFLQLKSENN